MHTMIDIKAFYFFRIDHKNPKPPLIKGLFSFFVSPVLAMGPLCKRPAQCLRISRAMILFIVRTVRLVSLLGQGHHKKNRKETCIYL